MWVWYIFSKEKKFWKKFIFPFYFETCRDKQCLSTGLYSTFLKICKKLIFNFQIRINFNIHVDHVGSFYLRIRFSVIAIWPFFGNISINLQSFLVFLYANSLYASLIFRSQSIAYNEVQLYFHIFLH